MFFTSDAFPHQQAPLAMDKRGFRVGAGDRFSHGFGKRVAASSDMDELYTTDNDDGSVRNGGELIDQLTRNPELLRVILQRYLDRNNDGFISRSELSNGRDEWEEKSQLEYSDYPLLLTLLLTLL